MTISNIVSVMPRDLSLLPCLAVQIIKERAIESIDIFDGDQLMLAAGECCVLFPVQKKKISFGYILLRSLLLCINTTDLNWS